jgi:hypothetical protein
MSNAPHSSHHTHISTRSEARKLVEGLWNGRLVLITRLAYLAGGILIVIGLLLRFLVEVPLGTSIPFTNDVFFTGAALFFCGLVALPMATQCFIASAQRELRKKEGPNQG